jgi:hypothetical protein
MAGGMSSGGREAERQAVHGTQRLDGKRPARWADALTGSEPGAPPDPSTVPPGEHCWYDGPPGRQAALLLKWRGGDGQYDGRIAVAALEPDGWAIVEMWVEQGMLSPP